jgi:hypothetical protein
MLNMQSKQIGPIFNLSPLKKTTPIHSRNKCGSYQYVLVTLRFPVSAQPSKHRGRYSAGIHVERSQGLSLLHDDFAGHLWMN